MQKPIQSLDCLQSEVRIFQITVTLSFTDIEKERGYLSEWQNSLHHNQNKYFAFNELW